MRKGFVVPYADSRDFAELAALGEEHGWDGIFTWEALWGVDAWVSLAAAALRGPSGSGSGRCSRPRRGSSPGTSRRGSARSTG